jgi:hypothetical protein
VAFVPVVVGGCTTLVACFAGIAVAGPMVGLGAIATYYLAFGTYMYIEKRFLEYKVELK